MGAQRIKGLRRGRVRPQGVGEIAMSLGPK